MTVAAPPRPQIRESAGHEPGDALFEEAKQRARRRRWFLGGAAAAVVAIVAVAIVSTGGTSSPHGARDVPTRPSPVPLGAPLVQGPDRASTVLTSWGGRHVGFVFVYADGRVIFQPDDDAFLPTGASRWSVAERRLSSGGLDLVRAGKLTAQQILVDPIFFPAETREIQPHGREKLWAEPTARKYEPSQYAICPSSVATREPLAATEVAGGLPAPAQALLDGKQRTYDPSIGKAGWQFTAPEPQHECFQVTTAEASTLTQILAATDQLITVPARASFVLSRGTAYEFSTEPTWWANTGQAVLTPRPLFPHGQYVTWGG